jgi:hypothetical protein
LIELIINFIARYENNGKYMKCERTNGNPARKTWGSNKKTQKQSQVYYSALVGIPGEDLSVWDQELVNDFRKTASHHGAKK